MKFKTACLAASMAAAGLATTGMAQAQSSVTLYGIVDISMEAYNHAPDGTGGSKTATGMRSGGLSASRWGLRGSEDLGNGMKAVFMLESGFNMPTGNGDGRMFQRTAMAGLETQYGKIGFGRQYTPAFSMMGQHVPGAYGSQYEPIPRIMPVRADNAVRVDTTFGGFTGGAYYSFTNQQDQVQNDLSPTGSFGAAIGYNFANRFRIMGGYDQFRGVLNPANGQLIPSRDGKAHNYVIGARADFGNFKVLGGYRHRRNDLNIAGVNDLRSDFYMIGVGYQVAPTTGIGIAYYRERFKDAPAAYLDSPTLRDDTWQQVSLLASYGLSKRTNVYAAAAHARGGSLNLGFAGDSGPAYTLAPGETRQTGGAIGLRHLF